MRLVSSLCMLSVVPLLLAAPRPTPPVQPAPGPEAQQFAVQLHNLAQEINRDYVRPVPVPDLLHAGLAALYEGARRPVPADLQARVEKAGTTGEIIPLIQQVYGQTAAVVSAQGRNPLVVACRGMMRLLDPFSGVVTQEEKRRDIALESAVYGVGLDLADYSGAGPLVVKTVYPGGAAQRAGIRPGDWITHVNGDPVEPAVQRTPPAERVRVLQQPLETVPFREGQPFPGPEKVVVTFRRASGPARTADLRREYFRVETVFGIQRDDGHRWQYWADPKKRIAYVRIAMLAYATPVELAEVLQRMSENGMRGLILDLRWTPGGYLTPSLEVAGFFVGSEATVATIKSRNDEDAPQRGRGPGTFADLPLVVLVNAETSGGAELIAAALQDHQRAIVVGQRTRGKASIQTTYESGPVPLKLTSGTFLRPSGKNLNRFPDSKPTDDWGVIPDVDARVSPALSRQLQEWWQWQTLRPGPSLERLPLDDPRADPQRNAAVEALAAILEKKAPGKVP